MISYVLNKAFYAFLTLFGVVTVIFLLFNILPGDPARMMLDQREDTEQLKNIRAKYGFDKPVLTQYLYYLNDVSPISFHNKDKKNYTFLSEEKYTYIKLIQLGEYSMVVKYPYLRKSFQKNGKKVSEVILETLPNTAVLAMFAIVIAIIIGILLGVLSALYKDTFFDRIIAVISTLGMSIPSFFSAILFAWLFGFVLHEYTGLEMTGSFYEVDDFGEGSYIQWKNLLLPALVLGIRPLAVVTQLMRNSLLETLNENYIRTAYAKGLTSYQVVKKHALKNSLNPVVTAISGWFASMLAGAVFVEYIFNWNGLGKEIVNALNTLDLPVIMGSVLVVATLFIWINICVDVVYSWLDPRIRLNKL
ncbi:ABC transporter permease [Tenacibaculum maritimum]|uniref:ABC transporter permease n=1 Tax=Tenacibaculum maritimum TaxID=107401 RepID=UPI0010A543A1|nr:ABC transporter permease [Tenacibaculum maritimum]QCD62901.1 ABC transporter permease [Tenacibaculum maritimum]CAA0151060.1 Dipeptide transport system permease protein DppB [Tenacibaculum maritimum]CAA0153250.1 Dipeptide transport system permease protein DppB [Tenacibaculum maritimum]CAA0192708.1 Dipeptide transport system permease protein DppB [Tenacibaculum maritimum]CAA0196606.1 Dipeptide transport system permease protein DppB [Tenacibaculum maritimum]